MTRCILVLEYDHDESTHDKGRVWIASSDRAPDLEGDGNFEDLEGWVLVCGAIDYEEASKIHGGLAAFLRGNGVEVADEGVARS